NIVFRLTGDDACVAADACAEVDCHTPGVFRRNKFRVERIRPFRLRPGLWSEARILSKLIYGRESDRLAVFHTRLVLRRYKLIPGAGLADFHIRQQPRRRRCPDAVCVVPTISNSTRSCASITEEQRDGFVCLAGHDPDRGLNVPTLRTDLDDV